MATCFTRAPLSLARNACMHAPDVQTPSFPRTVHQHTHPDPRDKTRRPTPGAECAQRDGWPADHTKVSLHCRQIACTFGRSGRTGRQTLLGTAVFVGISHAFLSPRRSGSEQLHCHCTLSTTLPAQNNRHKGIRGCIAQRRLRKCTSRRRNRLLYRSYGREIIIMLSVR